MLIIVILKNRSTPETETLRFLSSLYQAFLYFLPDPNIAERQSIGNAAAKLQIPVCGNSNDFFLHSK